ncbi:MAG: hypothetical protein K2N06_10240 [Oscillospiraceae bacterium]|nr:hypothetical protein [Oscillospiraceae bacterium]
MGGTIISELLELSVELDEIMGAGGLDELMGSGSISELVELGNSDEMGDCDELLGLDELSALDCSDDVGKLEETSGMVE